MVLAWREFEEWGSYQNPKEQKYAQLQDTRSINTVYIQSSQHSSFLLGVDMKRAAVLYMPIDVALCPTSVVFFIFWELVCFVYGLSLSVVFFLPLLACGDDEKWEFFGIRFISSSFGHYCIRLFFLLFFWPRRCFHHQVSPRRTQRTSSTRLDTKEGRTAGKDGHILFWGSSS